MEKCASHVVTRWISQSYMEFLGSRLCIRGFAAASCEDDNDIGNPVSNQTAKWLRGRCVKATRWWSYINVLSGYTSMSAQATFTPLRECITNADNTPSAPTGAPFTTHYRTLGEVAYFITSLNTHPSIVRSLEDKIWHILNGAWCNDFWYIIHSCHLVWNNLPNDHRVVM